MRTAKWACMVFTAMILVCGCHRANAATELTYSKNSLSNKFLKIQLDIPGQRFLLFRKGDTSAIIPNGRFLHLKGALKMAAPANIVDAKFGKGIQTVVKDADGNAVSLSLYANNPFLFVNSILSNKGKETAVIQKIQTLQFPIALKVPYERIRTQGTGFLSTPDKNPGSYVYMAVADQQTNRGVVAAWLTQDRGSGVVLAEKADGGPALTAQIDYGALRIAPGKTAVAETFLIGYFDDARRGLEQFADVVAKHYDIKLHRVMDGYCSWYSNPFGGSNDELHLKQLAKSSETLLKPYGLEFIQIDDQWQEGMMRNGPAKNFYAYKKTWPYPKGMKAAAADLTKRGFVPGLWWMPFAGDEEDPFFKKHLDWFVKTKDGKPFQTRWGGTSLDMTNPGAREYVASLASRIAKEWGYGYFKMDGLYTGLAVRQQYVNHEYKWDDIGEAVFSNPDKTNVEAFRDGLKLVREAAGDKVFFLGCTTAQNMRSFGASFGLVDAMRIGEDNNPTFNMVQSDLLAGPRAGSSRYFLNGRVWWNDPDPVYIRPSIPIEHARLITSWVGLTGMLMTYSEWLPDMPADRVFLLQRIMPNHGLKTRPVDFFDSIIPRIWLLTDTREAVRRDVLGLYNWDPVRASVIKYDPVKAGLPAAKEYVGFDFWNDRFLDSFKTIEFKVPKGDARIIAVRPASDHPQVISTNRHITQGIVDIESEKWSSGVLSGVSAVIAGEPYELRIVAPQGKKPWMLAKVSVDDPTMTTAFRQDGAHVRVTLTSATGGKVKWRMEFRQAGIGEK